MYPVWLETFYHQRQDDKLTNGKQVYRKRLRTIVIASVFFLSLFIVLWKSEIYGSTRVNFDKTDHNSKHSLQKRSYYDDLLKEDVDNNKDITGNLCMGYGVVCCVDIHFIHNSNIELHAIIGSKRKFTVLYGTYMHNNMSGTWQCDIKDVTSWNVVIKGNDTAEWIGDTKPIGIGRVGHSKEEILLVTQGFGHILDPEVHMDFKENPNENWNKVWNFQIKRDPVVVKVKVNLTVIPWIIPKLQITPNIVNMREGGNDLQLLCSAKEEFPTDSVLTWKKDEVFLGSYTFGLTHVLHRGSIGDVTWSDPVLKYYMKYPKVTDSGKYQCCISVADQPKQCVLAQVVISPPVNSSCTDVVFKPSSPFQINQFQYKPLLRNGKFVTIAWKFNISEWKISTRYPQCKAYLLNMEKGITQWFGNNVGITRSKRGIIEGILGGVGTLSGIANSMDVNSLKSDLESSGLIGSKTVKVQRSLNQILDNMIIKVASVTGPAILHLQEVILGLIDEAQQSQLARVCMEIQIEYSTNFKMIAQAFQGGITPLGITSSLPEEYQFAVKHTDLWVNKWLGCNQEECISTSLIPVAGKEQYLFPVTVLGVPVSTTQLIFYHINHPDFVFDSMNENIEPEQVDLSSCLHFPSKVICLPNQDKIIYHSCFHNHTSCLARVETVKSPNELITIVKEGKVCVQVMTDQERVKAFFSSCVHTEVLGRGLYCIEGDLTGVYFQNTHVNISSTDVRNIDALPIQYNISQMDEFPWRKWTEEIRKDRGLLLILKEQLKEAEIVFNHEQGVLQDIEHQWSELSGSSFWGKLKKSVSIWSKSSANSVASNILLNPLTIMFIIIIACVVIQIIIMVIIRRNYNRVGVELRKAENIFQEMFRRNVQSNHYSSLRIKDLNKASSHGL